MVKEEYKLAIKHNGDGEEIINFLISLGYKNYHNFVGKIFVNRPVYYCGGYDNTIHCCIYTVGIENVFESLEEAKKYYNMEEKELKIQIPEGYEIDKENSTFECIKFKKKKLTYEDVSKILFDEKNIFYINSSGKAAPYFCKRDQCEDSSNYTSKEQAEKLLAINKLMNVAKYLNGDWTPNWNDNAQSKYYFYLTNAIYISIVTSMNLNTVYFKTRELAEKAIKILGEETIRLALSTDY